MSGLRLLISKSNSPYINLAIEEYLIDNNIECLYLWCNEPAIVIGRSQNPYKECNLEALREDKVHLCRRRSGGGAVYHDLGNLNFTIITKKSEDSITLGFSLVKAVLKNFSIAAEVSGRNDLEVNGMKISGSAFFENDLTYLHHGTLLIDTNLDRMKKYLKPSKLKLEAKGIESVRARVINLHELNPNINREAIIASFIKVNGIEPIYINEADAINNPLISKIKDKYESFKWIYGEAMDYNCSLADRFPFGIVEINLDIKNGIIKNAKIYTDSIIIDSFDRLERALEGVRLIHSDILECINNNINNAEIRKGLISLFKI